MEPSETPRTYQADEENAQAQSGDIRCKAQIKVSDTADKQIPNNKIEESQIITLLKKLFFRLLNSLVLILY